MKIIGLHRLLRQFRQLIMLLLFQFQLLNLTFQLRDEQDEALTYSVTTNPNIGSLAGSKSYWNGHLVYAGTCQLVVLGLRYYIQMDSECNRWN